MKKILCLALLVQMAYAGNETGNGGDYVRMKFLEIGRKIVYGVSLDVFPSLPKFTSDFHEKLASTLKIDIIKTVNTPLIDNTGSNVNAIGELGKIILANDFWGNFLKQESDEVYQMVFHEILRAAGINDDEYRYSRHIGKFDFYGNIHCYLYKKKTEIGTGTEYEKLNELKMKITGKNQYIHHMVEGTIIASLNEYNLSIPTLRYSWREGMTEMPLYSLVGLKEGETKKLVVTHHHDTAQITLKMSCLISR